MTRRLLRLTVFELRKLAARRLPVLALVLVVLVALLAPAVGRAVDTASSLMSGKLAQGDGWKNGWTAMASAVSTARLFVFIVVLILAGSAVAEEAAHGTLKTLFTRPLRRAELLLAKALATWSWGALLLVVAVAAALLGGELTKGLYDVADPVFHVTKHTFGAMLRYTALATLVTLAPLAALTGLGLLASCLSDHPGHATGGAIGALFLLSGIAGVSTGWLQDALFVSYSAAPFEVVDALANQFAGEKDRLALPAVVQAVGVSAVWAAATFGAASWLLGRRDIGG